MLLVLKGQLVPRGNKALMEQQDILVSKENLALLEQQAQMENKEHKEYKDDGEALYQEHERSTRMKEPQGNTT